MERRRDFKQRMAKTHEREKLVKILSAKAKQRNPDEFRFAMKNATLVNGKYVKKTNQADNKPRLTSSKLKAKKR